MSESQRIVTLARRAQTRGEQVCLATVVHVEGSAYRKPGARMLLTSGGERAGTISGGCLESEVSRKAWWLIAGGARVERYSSFSDEDGGMPYGLGCGGTVWLLLERGEPAAAVLAALEHVLSTRQPAVVAMALCNAPGALSSSAAIPSRSLAQNPEVADRHSPAGTLGVWTLRSSHPRLSQTLAPDKCPATQSPSAEAMYRRPGLLERGSESGSERAWASIELAARTAFAQRRSCLLTESFELYRAGAYPSEAHAKAPAYWIEYLPAPPAISIFGAGDDAQPIAELAHALGWRVSVVDGRAHLARRERFPQADEVRVLDYADPALRAACGIARLSVQPAAGHRASSKQRPGASQGSLDAAPHRLLTDESARLVRDDIAVVLTHSYEQDRAILAALLSRELRYLGILGPRHRTEQLLAEIVPELSLTVAEAFERLHSPIGLDLGAGDPSAVALSIIAEIQAVLHGRQIEVRRTEPAQAGPEVKLLDEDSLGAARA